MQQKKGKKEGKCWKRNTTKNHVKDDTIPPGKKFQKNMKCPQIATNTTEFLVSLAIV